MLCRESRRLLGAYVDTELDLVTSLALGDHVVSCAACAHELDSQQLIKRLVRDAAPNIECSPDLRQKILRTLTAQEDKPTSALWRRTGVQRAGAMAAVIVVLLIAVYSLRTGIDKMPLNEVIDNHIRSMLANHLADVASSDQHTVKPWFNGKLTFSPEVTDFADKGYPLVGGRLDYMNHEPVAVVIYKRRQHIINIFSYPSTASINAVVSEERGYTIIHWSYRDIEYWMISDLNRHELESLEQLLRG
ncbi:MAG TPA: anti-sigma factor [Candidatus Angelobacter sp.]|nr:anti-sigma factor [Candidatus Angelobacter sp.]